MLPLKEIWDIYNTNFPTEAAGKLKLIKVPEMLPGTAAFPVSAGLIRAKGNEDILSFPTHGVMFIGNDPDSEANYKKRLKCGCSHGDREEPKCMMLFWKRTYKLLDRVAQSKSDCFFTNVFAALREGEQKNAGGWRGESKFLDWCLEFLGKQICIMAPRLVVVFGKQARKSLAVGGGENSELCLCDTRICANTDPMIRKIPLVRLDHPSRWPTRLSCQEKLDSINAERLASALKRGEQWSYEAGQVQTAKSNFPH